MKMTRKTETGQSNLLGPKLSSVVTMSEPTVVAETPSEQVAVRDNSSTVRAATGDVTHSLRPQRFNQSRLLTVPAMQ